MIGALYPHAQTTEGVCVRVAVSFLPEQSQEVQGRWYWAYHIRIENHRDDVVQLRSRHWEITDARGALHIVEGEGVIGEQPIIEPRGAYDYVSACPLATPSGHMKGYFVMLDGASQRFRVAIPRFPLTVPTVSQ